MTTPSLAFLQKNFPFFCTNVTDHHLEFCIQNNTFIKNWDIVSEADQHTYDYILELDWNIMYNSYLDWILQNPNTSFIDDDVGFYQIDTFLQHFLPSICSRERSWIDPQVEYVNRHV
jgi:hypothetical protein